ncbi:MAG: insulinase family protein [Muribaculaceae bacterium]|nr:insulinase family protein [Muribaculaceae bacterium]
MTELNHPTYYISSRGLRMVHLHLSGAAVGHFGVAVNVGSRDEAPEVFGLSHFVEHTIFKGTDTHRSSYIINRMEAVGGELNAYTSKEETVVYSTFPAGNLRRAMELIADLVANSRFPERELEKEREVVADEIDSYLDSPADAVFDDFDDLLFAGHGIGHNILGTRAALDTFTPDVCRQYLKTYYTADNIVLFYAGDEAADKFFSRA